MNTLTNPQWRNVRLGDIGQSLIGLTYSPSNVKRSGTLVLRSSNIQDGELAFDDNVYVDCAIPEKIRTRENDILICVRNGSRRLIGKSAILDRRVSGQTFGAFMAVYRSDLNPFLRYFFQSDDFKRQIDEHLGATINQITNGSLNGFVVTLPSESEQQAITERLQDVDRLIATLKRLISKKQSIKQGMMQELLTGRTRLPGFSASWFSSTWGELALEISSGATPRRGVAEYWNGEIPWVTSTELKRGPVDFIPQSITTAGLRAANLRVWPAGTFLMAITGLEAAGTRGKCGLLSVAAATNQSCMAVAPGPDLDTEFLFYYYLHYGNDLAFKYVQGTKQQSYTAAIVKKLPIHLPSDVSEQQAIAQVLRDADHEIAALERCLESARNIKQGMMQELLSGRTRLPFEGESA